VPWEETPLLDKIEFLIGESLKAFRRNGWMAFAAISTVAVSMFLMGGLSYAYYALSHYAQNQFPTQFTMDVFLKDGTTTDQIQRTAQEIRGIDGVNHVVLIPKEKAYPKLLKEYGLPAPTEEEGIPIQDKFQVTLNDVSEENSAIVGSEIQRLPTVADQGVKYLVAEQRFIDQVLSLLRLLGSLIGGLLFITAGILIYNAIRLTIVSRRLEIRVMQLVGASRITIQIPFLFEGIIQGAVGGTLSGFFLLATYKLLDTAISGFDAFGSLPYFPVWPVVGMLAIIGALYGFLSSWLALTSPLRYR
jgi:cell division transport system permease protein